MKSRLIKIVNQICNKTYADFEYNNIKKWYDTKEYTNLDLFYMCCKWIIKSELPIEDILNILKSIRYDFIEDNYNISLNHLNKSINTLQTMLNQYNQMIEQVDNSLCLIAFSNEKEESIIQALLNIRENIANYCSLFENTDSNHDYEDLLSYLLIDKKGTEITIDKNRIEQHIDINSYNSKILSIMNFGALSNGRCSGKILINKNIIY